MKTSLLLMILVLLLLGFSPPAGRAQMQPPAQAHGDAGLPDFSGFNLIDSFARLPAERTNLSTLCDVRQASIDEITGNIEGALKLADESSDPAAAVRLHNAMGVVFLYKGDVTGAIAQFEEGVRIAHQHSTDNLGFRYAPPQALCCRPLPRATVNFVAARLFVRRLSAQSTFAFFNRHNQSQNFLYP